MQVWSKDAYESVEHRVILNSEEGRFSIPYFYNPAHYTMVKPSDELTNEGNHAKYRAYSWGKFATTSKLNNFKKLDIESLKSFQGEETVSIDNFLYNYTCDPVPP